MLQLNESCTTTETAFLFLNAWLYLLKWSTVKLMNHTFFIEFKCYITFLLNCDKPCIKLTVINNNLILCIYTQHAL